MKTDAQILLEVLEELKCEPKVDETQVGVTIKDSMVIPQGNVKSYDLRSAVEDAVLSVSGIKDVL